MAKANNTAIEQILEFIKGWLSEDGTLLCTEEHLIEKIRELKKIERQQIDAAFNNGRWNTYKDAGHYYFMEYIDND